jgi:hypothetical protein
LKPAAAIETAVVSIVVPEYALYFTLNYGYEWLKRPGKLATLKIDMTVSNKAASDMLKSLFVYPQSKGR